MLKGFRDFVMRGNVIDLAIAVVAGAAFTALITAFTKSMITPLIGLVLGGGVNAGQVTVNGQVFDFTLLINAFITFVATMAVLYFIVVAPMKKLVARMEKEKEEEAAEASEEIALLREIRDALVQRQT